MLDKPFPAYTGDGPYIFVCYAHDDAVLVYPEIQWLHDQGINVWYDEGISPGAEWSEELGLAIQGADRLLMFVTPAAVASRHCRNELHFSQNHGTAILAVHLAETELPVGLELAMGSSQAIHGPVFRDRLIRALETSAAPVDSQAIDVPRPPATRQTLSLKHKSLVAVGMLLLVAIAALLITWDSDEDAPQRQISEQISIAILPFVNRSATTENAEFLAEGIHDELVTRLGAVDNLKVISRTSMLAYRNTTKNIRTISEELGVVSVLEGSVQRAGESVRISATLIDADTETQLWTGTFDRSLTTANLFAIQAEISIAIAGALRANLSPTAEARLTSVPTDDLPALEAYFRGKQLLEIRTTNSLIAARSHFQQAVERDPSFAHAYAGLAEAWLELPNYTAGVDPAVVRESARSNAEMAIELNPELPEALAVLGWERLMHRFDWQGAEQALGKALEIQPGNVNALHWMSHVRSWQGDHQQALALAERVALLDPLSTLIRRNLAYINMDAGNFDLSIRQFEELVESDPYSSSLENLWTAQLRAGRFNDAADTFDIWVATRGRDQAQVDQLQAALFDRGNSGKPVMLDPLVLSSFALTPSDSAQIHGALQDSDGTLASLEECFRVATHSRSLLSMRINPSFDFLRTDARFQELLEKIGLSR